MTRKIAYSFLPVFMVCFCLTACTGRAQPGKETLLYLSEKFSIHFIVNSKFKERKDSLNKSLNCQAYNASIIWNDSLPDERLKIQLTNNNGLSLVFDLDKLDKTLPFLLKLTAESDTIARDVPKVADITIGLPDNNYLVHWRQDVVRSYPRLKGEPRTYAFTPDLAKTSMQIRYGSDSIYNKTMQMMHDGEMVAIPNRYMRICMDGDTLCLLGQNTKVIMKDSTGFVTPVSSIVKYYKHQLIGVYPIMADGYVCPGYFFQGNGFMCHGDTCYGILGKYQGSPFDHRIWGKFVKNAKDQYIFAGLTEDRFPIEYEKYKMLYMFNSAINHYPYYMMPMSNRLTNIVTGKSHILTYLFATPMKIKPDGTYDQVHHNVWDFRIDKNFVASITISEGDDFYYVRYDINNNKVMIRKKLRAMCMEGSAPSVDKWDHNYIVYVYGKNLIRDNISLYHQD